MTDKRLYAKKCRECGLVFRTDNPHILKCPTCQKGKAPNKNNNKGTPSICRISLAVFMYCLTKYNAENSLCLTYGQAVSLLYNKRIKKDNFF